jgi:hypothetical protein
MQIDVIGTSPLLTSQTCAYTEYRMFSRLAPLAREVSAVLVVLSRVDDTSDTFCQATASLRTGGPVLACARHPHPTGAIDATADKLSAAVQRRLQPAVTL